MDYGEIIEVIRRGSGGLGREAAERSAQATLLCRGLSAGRDAPRMPRARRRRAANDL
jgi:hypothetical protein